MPVEPLRREHGPVREPRDLGPGDGEAAGDGYPPSFPMKAAISWASARENLNSSSDGRPPVPRAVKTEWMRDWAEMAGVEFLLIDAATDPEALREEVRRNEAAYRSGI